MVWEDTALNGNIEEIYWLKSAPEEEKTLRRPAATDQLSYVPVSSKANALLIANVKIGTTPIN